jgi:hypothetical protein
MLKKIVGILVMFMASTLLAGEYIDLLPETAIDTVTQNDTAKITIRVDPKDFSHSIVLTSSIGIISPSVLTPPLSDSVVTLIVLSRQCINGQNPVQITAMNGAVVLDEIRCTIFGNNIEDMLKWTVYDTSNSELPDNYVKSIAFEDNGTKWFATAKGGLAAFEGNIWKVYNTDNSSLSRNNIYQVTIDNNDAKWIFMDPGAGNGGVFVFNDTVSVQYDTANSEIPDIHINDIFIDHTGTKWISTDYGGVASFNDEEWLVYNTDNSSLLSNHVLATAEESDGTKWFSVSGKGVAAFDGQFWSVYTEDNSGLVDDNVNCITIDSDGTKWFGYQTNYRMSSFNGADWRHYSRGTSASGVIRKIVIDSDGTKWVSTGSSGIASLIDNERWMFYNTENSPLPSNRINDIAIESDGTKWLATDQGIVCVKTIENPQPALTASTVIDTVEDGQYAQIIVTIDPSRFSDTVTLVSTHGYFLSGAQLVPPFAETSATLTVLSQDLSGGANIITITAASGGKTVNSTQAELYLKTLNKVIETRGQRMQQVIQVRLGGEVALHGFPGKQATISFHLLNGQEVFMKNIPLNAGIGIFKLPALHSGIGVLNVECIGKTFRRTMFCR